LASWQNLFLHGAVSLLLLVPGHRKVDSDTPIASPLNVSLLVRLVYEVHRVNEARVVGRRLPSYSCLRDPRQRRGVVLVRPEQGIVLVRHSEVDIESSRLYRVILCVHKVEA